MINDKEDFFLHTLPLPLSVLPHVFSSQVENDICITLKYIERI